MSQSEHPVEYLLYIKYMNEEDYFEAHEVLEGYWHGERIDFYKGLIQVAVGLYHLDAGNIAGCLQLFTRARQLLQPYRPLFRAMDVERIVHYLDDCVTRIPSVAEMERDEVQQLAIPHIKLWLEDGTPIPTDLTLEEDEDDGHA